MTVAGHARDGTFAPGTGTIQWQCDDRIRAGQMWLSSSQRQRAVRDDGYRWHPDGICALGPCRTHDICGEPPQASTQI